MPEYTYEALAQTGIRNQGTLVATSEREALAMLDARGLFPIKIAAKSIVTGKGGKAIKKSLLCTFYAQLADLLHSGVPLLRSLDILERQTSTASLSAVVREIRSRVADGTSLAQAMAQHPMVFDELVISMVRAGSEGGFLEDVLKRVADFTEHQEDLKAKVTGAMAYPVFLGIVGFVVLNILIIFFVPLFKDVFKRLEDKGEMPFLTTALVTTSYYLRNYGLFVLGAAALVWYLIRRWTRTDSGRLVMDHLWLKSPGVGKIVLNLALSRFTRILGTMLHNGIPILQALRIAKDSTGNRILAIAIDKSAENIKAGDSLSGPLSASQYFPRDIVEMVAVGEESNNLEKVLIDISEGLEKRTNRQLELFVRLLEPLMLMLMAGATLLVVAGLLIPIFKMSSSMG